MVRPKAIPKTCNTCTYIIVSSPMFFVKILIENTPKHYHCNQLRSLKSTFGNDLGQLLCMKCRGTIKSIIMKSWNAKFFSYYYCYFYHRLRVKSAWLLGEKTKQALFWGFLHVHELFLNAYYKVPPTLKHICFLYCSLTYFAAYITT